MCGDTDDEGSGSQNERYGPGAPLEDDAYEDGNMAHDDADVAKDDADGAMANDGSCSDDADGSVNIAKDAVGEADGTEGNGWERDECWAGSV